MSTTLTVSGSGGFTVEVSLETGECHGEWRGRPGDEWVEYYWNEQRTISLRFAPEQLEPLDELAAKMRAQGDDHYREQFASAGIYFQLDDEHGRVDWKYELDGGTPMAVEPTWDLIADAVWDEVRAQRAAEAARSWFRDLESTADLMPIHRETAPWLGATELVATRHGLTSAEWTRAGDGSHIVMLSEQFALKFYVPFWPDAIENEERALWHLRYEKLGVELPQLKARGELDGWQYMAVTRIAGTALRDVHLTDDEALEVARDLGRTIRALHDVDVPKDSPLRDIVPKWRPFLTENRRGRREHELQRGTPEVWADRLVDYLRSWRYRKRPTNTLIHADLTNEHIMLRQVDGRWKLAGIIDFGDVKVGDPAYDFAAPFAFWTADRPDLRRAMLEAYGADESWLDRIFESMILHEYGALASLELDDLGSIDDVRRRYIDLNT